jgi:RelA/SpoT family (p)ppGpp synthetase
VASIKEIAGLLKASEKGDLALLEKAFHFAEKAHKNQNRLSGDPYLIHLAETGKILAEYGMSAKTVAAGILHDILDTNVDKETLRAEFGDDITFMVEGVNTLGTFKYHGSDRHNESLRKLLVAMSKDIRVLMIKLADRLHNMRTLSHVPKEKQKRIAGETLEIFAPIAYRLGIRKLSRELEDLAFSYVYPEEYEKLQKMLQKQYKESVESLEKFLKSLKKALAKESVLYIRTEYRVKGAYSLSRKLQTKKKHAEEIYDILALRVLVPTVADCYKVLGVVHGSWRPLPGKIKDYIAFPKPNGYQALHTTVFTGDGSVVEIQIKTEEMYEHSEYGIASHISYKSKKSSGNLAWIQHLLPKGLREGSEDSGTLRWIQDFVEYEEDRGNIESSNFFDHRIFVFSPLGDVVDLPMKSSPVDFAYSIHSSIGDHMAGAKVNNKMVSLDTELKNGDIVEIITRSSAQPSTKWLEYATTTGARHKIRSAIQKNKRKLR